MKKVHCKSFKEAIDKLQKHVDNNWHNSLQHKSGELPKRRWLKSIPEDSYGDSNYRIELWVLEGSPAKEVALIDHGHGTIICHSGSLLKEIIFTWVPHHGSKLEKK